MVRADTLLKWVKERIGSSSSFTTSEQLIPEGFKWNRVWEVVTPGGEGVKSQNEVSIPI